MVGMEKNCGKTECLNYIIRRLPLHERKVCVTSIGLDGERTDQVTRTPKPEIVLREGMFFSTSETHYRARRMVSEIVDISDETTALGRLITAKVVSEGKVILSGPSSTASLRRWMSGIAGFGIDLTIIDGALSRKSSASPAVSDAMVLATGAALSSSLPALIDLTAFCVTMIRLPLAETPGDAAHTVTVSSMASDIGIDRLLSRLTQEGGVDRYEVVVEDFTRIFVTPGQYRSFVRAGGRLGVRRRTVLLAVCANPLAPNGYRMDSELLCARLSDKLQIPVYDIKRHEA